MAWMKIGKFAALSLALAFAACGDDSGSGSSNPEQTSESDSVVIERFSVVKY